MFAWLLLNCPRSRLQRHHFDITDLCLPLSDFHFKVARSRWQNEVINIGFPFPPCPPLPRLSPPPLFLPFLPLFLPAPSPSSSPPPPPPLPLLPLFLPPPSSSLAPFPSSSPCPPPLQIVVSVSGFLHRKGTGKSDLNTKMP